MSDVDAASATRIKHLTRVAMDEFFAAVQFKAYRQAEWATGSREEALDIVQDAMLRLAQKYSDQEENWPKLFQRILQNAIRDWYRRKKVKSALFWFQREIKEDQEDHDDMTHQVTADAKVNPFEQLQSQEIGETVFSAIKSLPLRQQQAFILRAWWEYDTRDSAFVMNCTEGSVKTHYSRAVGKLNELLADKDL